MKSIVSVLRDNLRSEVIETLRHLIYDYYYTAILNVLTAIKWNWPSVHYKHVV